MSKILKCEVQKTDRLLEDLTNDKIVSFKGMRHIYPSTWNKAIIPNIQISFQISTKYIRL